MEPLVLEPVASLEGHSDRVWSVAWSPRGDMLASCSGDKTIRIWARRPGQAPAAPPDDTPHPPPRQQEQQHWYCAAILDNCHSRTIRCVAWAPSGRALASASFDATVAVWELSGGVWEHVAELEGHENEVKCVAWNPDGRMIATCGRDRSVWIWESMPGREFECVDVKQGHSQDVKVVRWHPGGELLVSAAYDDSIKLWTNDGDEWVCAQTLGGAGGTGGHESTVWDVAWDAAGQRLASCSDDLTIRLWASRGAAAHAGPPPSAAAADAGAFVPAHPDLRCAATLRCGHQRSIFSLDWSAADVLATGDGDDCITLLGCGDPEAAQMLLRHADMRDAGDNADEPMQLAADGSRSAAGHNGDAHMAEAAGAKQAERSIVGGASAAGQVAGAEEEVVLQLSQPGGTWCVWGRVAGAHNADVNCVRWNPAHPRLLASCSDDGLVKLWWLRPV